MENQAEAAGIDHAEARQDKVTLASIRPRSCRALALRVPVEERTRGREEGRKKRAFPILARLTADLCLLPPRLNAEGRALLNPSPIPPISSPLFGENLSDLA